MQAHANGHAQQQKKLGSVVSSSTNDRLSASSKSSAADADASALFTGAVATHDDSNYASGRQMKAMANDESMVVWR